MSPEEIEKGKEDFLNALKELRNRRDQRIKKTRRFLLWMEYILMFVGLGIIAYRDYWIAIGIYLVIFSNNMGIFRVLGKKGLKIFEDTWKD